MLLAGVILAYTGFILAAVDVEATLCGSVCSSEVGCVGSSEREEVGVIFTLRGERTTRSLVGWAVCETGNSALTFLAAGCSGTTLVGTLCNDTAATPEVDGLPSSVSYLGGIFVKLQSAKQQTIVLCSVCNQIFRYFMCF